MGAVLIGVWHSIQLGLHLSHQLLFFVQKVMVSVNIVGFVVDLGACGHRVNAASMDRLLVVLTTYNLWV